MTNIRRAMLADAEQIATIRQAVWPDSSVDLAHIATVLSDPQHQTIVAVSDNRMTGYMACFATLAQDGTRRWEMDELAVHPDYRRQQIGYRLVAEATKAGRQYRAVFARALIEVNNLASQQTFARCGYKTDASIYGLYICTMFTSGQASVPPDLHLVPVQTLSYRGVWLEGKLSQEAFAAVRHLNNYGLAGALIPLSNHPAIYAAARAGFRLVNNYQWWIAPL
jgi:ribosomal protein S18 acetylase RimI-like enzyme